MGISFPGGAKIRRWGSSDNGIDVPHSGQEDSSPQPNWSYSHLEHGMCADTANGTPLKNDRYSPYFAMICSFFAPRISYLRPTLVKAAIARSMWCGSWAAESCTRMRAAPLGTTGW